MVSEELQQWNLPDLTLVDVGCRQVMNQSCLCESSLSDCKNSGTVYRIKNLRQKGIF